MESFCRGCLVQCSDPADFLQYTEKNRRLFIYSTGLQVKRNDTFTFQLCKQCYYSMKQSCRFKKICRASDMKFRNFVMHGEDGVDFGSFIKNMEAHLSLRLPLTLGHSTPSHRKEKDDDNESTCTSIRNFMTEMLEGEEMAPSEARIIREVIEEEADVLDDSLDSHWLDDDQSAGSDVEMDFGSSPFGTPRSEHHNHGYILKKPDELKEDIKFTSKFIEEIDKPRIPQKYDMPLLEDMNSNMEFDIGSINQNKVDNNIDKSPIEFNNSIPSEVADMVTENSISSMQCFKAELIRNLADSEGIEILDNDSNLFGDLTKDSNIKQTIANESDVCIVLNQGVAVKKEPSNDIEFYLNRAELKKQILSSKNLSKKYHCTIDRNLDVALKNEDSIQFSLDQLITSPAVSLRSGQSTPTINHLLFGENTSKANTSTPMIENLLFGDKLDSKTPPRYFPQVGQNVDENDIGQRETLKNEDMQNSKSQTEFNEVETVQNDHMDVLVDFLQGSAETPIDYDIDRIIDPDEIKDQDIFKRPMTPPHDKYDLEKCFCKICDKTFGSVRAIKIHFAKIHKYKFPSRDPHGNKLQNNKYFICDFCGITIKGGSHFSKHKKIHEIKGSSTQCQCNYCKQYFNSKIGVQTHIIKMHLNLPIKKKKYQCSFCGKLSGNKSHFNVHRRRHLKQFTVFCTECDKGFYDNFALKKHMLSHTGECPFGCNYCKATFKSRDSLNMHMKRHLGQYHYKCKACNMEFVAKHHLERHYSSSTCLDKIVNSPKQKTKEVKVSFGKGSIEKIKKLMKRSASDLESESEAENAPIDVNASTAVKIDP